MAVISSSCVTLAEIEQGKEDKCETPSGQSVPINEGINVREKDVASIETAIEAPDPVTSAHGNHQGEYHDETDDDIFLEKVSSSPDQPAALMEDQIYNKDTDDETSQGDIENEFDASEISVESTGHNKLLADALSCIIVDARRRIQL